MTTYKIDVEHIKVEDDEGIATGHLYRVGFGDPATNVEIVREAEATLVRLVDQANLGGWIALVYGPTSIPVAFVLAHHLAHRYSVVGVWDPKLQQFVVVISHRPDHSVGALLKVAVPAREGGPS